MGPRTQESERIEVAFEVSHWRKALKMRSRSGLEPLLDDLSITAAAPSEVLSFGVAI